MLVRIGNLLESSRKTLSSHHCRLLSRQYTECMAILNAKSPRLEAGYWDSSIQYTCHFMYSSWCKETTLCWLLYLRFRSVKYTRQLVNKDLSWWQKPTDGHDHLEFSCDHMTFWLTYNVPFISASDKTFSQDCLYSLPCFRSSHSQVHRPAVHGFHSQWLRPCPQLWS